MRLVPGKPRPVGMDCINEFDVTAATPGGQIAITSDGNSVLKRDARYETALFSNLVAENTTYLEAFGDSLTAELVEKLATEVMSEDFYFTDGDEVGTTIDTSAPLKRAKE